jgi:hypothetical protein
MAKAPELRASDLAAVSKWGRAAGLLHQLLRRPDPKEMLEERRRRGDELREGIDWPGGDGSPEAIVIRLRDYARYPQIDDRVFDFSSSSWFKFELKEVRDDCLEVFDSIQEVRIRNGKAREIDYQGDHAHLVYVVGRIPLENIAVIDWRAEPYYGLPRFYCHYGRRGPFREIVLYVKDGARFVEMEGIVYKGRNLRMPRRLWLNWRLRREDKAAQKELRRDWEDDPEP